MPENLSAGHRIEKESLWEAARFAGDGYDRAAVMEKRTKWRAISAWGRDGWDLGDWPYVVVYFRTNAGPQCTDDCTVDCGHCKGEKHYWDYATNVEGDTDCYRFDTEAERNRAVDEVAFFYWKYKNREWIAGMDSYEDMPPEMCGPFSMARLDAEKPLPATPAE